MISPNMINFDPERIASISFKNNSSPTIDVSSKIITSFSKGFSLVKPYSSVSGEYFNNLCIVLPSKPVYSVNTLAALPDKAHCAIFKL